MSHIYFSSLFLVYKINITTAQDILMSILKTKKQYHSLVYCVNRPTKWSIKRLLVWQNSCVPIDESTSNMNITF